MVAGRRPPVARRAPARHTTANFGLRTLAQERRGRIVADPLIVVPDDFPSVFAGTDGGRRCQALGETRVYSERGADEEAELIRRIDRARVAINIRAHARFTDGVFMACRNLKMVSIWGTGTDNFD